MAVLDKAAEEEIKVLYLDSDETLAQIGARYGVTAPAISQLARRRGWPMRYDRNDVRLPGADVLQHVRAHVAQRMGAALVVKLRKMEAAMRSGKLSSQDFERDAKSVAAMMIGFDKTTAGHEDNNKTAKSAGAGEPEPLDEAERLHREILERFDRIQRRRDAEGGSE
jgi:hypothetical protein